MKNSVWKTFMELSLVRGIVPRTVFGLTAIAAIILVIGLALSKSNKRGRLHPLIVSLIAAVLAGAAGMLVAWLVSDVFMVFGVSLGWPVIFTIAGGIAGVGFVIAAAVTLRGVRRALAVVLVPLVLLYFCAVHRARRGLDLRRIPDHRHPRRLHAVRLARLNRGTQGRDERQRLA